MDVCIFFPPLLPSLTLKPKLCIIRSPRLLIYTYPFKQFPGHCLLICCLTRVFLLYFSFTFWKVLCRRVCANMLDAPCLFVMDGSERLDSLESLWVCKWWKGSPNTNKNLLPRYWASNVLICTALIIYSAGTSGCLFIARFLASVIGF